MPDRRQTQSYLRNLFARRGIAPQHRYGQNFLIDLNLHELIVEGGGGRARTTWCSRSGRGRGRLTALMAERGAAVVAVEIDPAMAGSTAEAVGRACRTSGCSTPTPWRASTTINPEVLDNVRAGLAVAPERRFKLVANLPYNVATPIVTNLLVHPELCPSRMVVDDPARAGRADARRAEHRGLRRALGAGPGAGRRARSCGRSRRASSGRARRSSRPSSRSSPTRRSGPRSATSPGSTRSSARSSSTAARTSAASSTASGATADQARGRRPARIARPDRPDPRRGDERRGAHRPGRRPEGSGSAMRPERPTMGRADDEA